jgi:predicted negative regulator of RcsB-dependent stress response
MTDEPMSAKKFIKVWSQAGASLVMAIITLGLLFGWVTWDTKQVAAVMGVYGAVMMVLRQMFSVTDNIEYVGDINVAIDDDGKKVISLDVAKDPDKIENYNKVAFKVNAPAVGQNPNESQ